MSSGMPPGASPGPSRPAVALVAALLLAATAAAWHPLLSNEFVNYDDDLYITGSDPVRRGLTPEGVGWAFTSLQGANWFPLTRLSWMVDAELYGIDARGFHATSGLLHAATSLLLFAAMIAMTGALWRSAFAAGVFALHPLHVESVAWAAARKDVLSGLFFALGLCAWISAVRREGSAKAWLRAATAACLALGLLAKQMLVTFPFVLLLLDEWPLRRLRDPASGRYDPARLRRAVLEKGPLFALAALGAVVAVLAQQSGGTLQTLERLPLGARLGNAVVALVIYLRKAFWPLDLAVFYPHPGASLPGWQVGGALLLLALLAGGAIASLRRRPYLAVGLSLFVGMLVPVLGVVQIGVAALADRYMYLPLLGLALALAFALGELAARGPALRAACAAVGVAALVGLGAATSAQLRVWRDSFTLFEHALAVAGESHVAHLNLGVALLNAGRVDEAAPHLAAAVRLAPASSMAAGVLGELELRQGRAERAAAHFRTAIAGGRDVARWHAGLGQALFEQGELDEAVRHYRIAVEARPRQAAAHANLALALARLGRTDEALDGYREALRLDPGRAEVHGNLGIALAASGRREEALEAYRRALQLDPELALVHAQLGRLLAESGRPDAGLRHLDEAVRLEPEAASFRAARGRVYEGLGREREAVADYRAALRSGERDRMLLNNLAWILATSRDPQVASPEEAVAFAEAAVAADRRRSPEILDTLAVAYAAAGREDDALRTTREALTRAEAVGRPDLATTLRARLP